MRIDSGLEAKTTPQSLDSKEIEEVPDVSTCGLISLCTIMRNEESNIIQFLESFKDWVDEIIIVDTGSTDKTLDLAVDYCQTKNINLIIERFEWIDDFSAARNVGIEVATCKWIFWADADDRISLNVGHRLRMIITSDPDFDVLNLRVVSKVSDGRIDEVPQPRIFRRSLGLRFKGPIHETIPQESAYKNRYIPDLKIEHTGYFDPELLQKKRERNEAIILKHLDQPLMMFYHARTYLAAGEHHNALGCFLYIISEMEAPIGLKSEVVYNIGTIYLKFGAIEEAIRFLEISRSIDATYFLGKCYEVKNEPGTARDYYANYIALAENANSPFGSLRLTLAPKALERVREICQNESNHWAKFELELERPV